MLAPHSSTLAWKIPWAEEPGGCSPRGHEESDTTERLHFHFSLSCIREGNGNPLHCSCLENPRDRGAWWAAVYGVAQSQTWLKWLSSSNSDSQNVILRQRVSITWGPDGDKLSDPIPHLLSQKQNGAGLGGICILISLPGESDTCESLRITGPVCLYLSTGEHF